MTSLFDDLILLGSYILVGMVVIYDVILDTFKNSSSRYYKKFNFRAV